MGLGTRPSDDERLRLAALAAEPPPASPSPRLVASPQPAQRGSLQDASARMPSPAAVPPLPAAHSGVVLPQQPVFVAQPSVDDEHYDELSFNVFPAATLLTPSASRDDAVLVRLIHPFAEELKGDSMSIASFIDGETEAAEKLSTLPNRRVASRAR
jgi:hypothetical protein